MSVNNPTPAKAVLQAVTKGLQKWYTVKYEHQKQMDYLDPDKKRSHRIRLYIGYGLLTIAIAIATVILVYIGNGFFLDKETGDLIQNGQLFVNSDPDGAKIYLNGREQRTKTAGRLVVPSGTYNITIKREGYRDWNAKDVKLDGGVVERLDYARLLPITLTSTTQQTFATTPYKVSESSDRRYLALFFADHPLSVFVIDLTKPEAIPQEIALPKSLFSDPTKIGQLELSEWANGSNFFMVKNVVNGTVLDHLLINREEPAQSVNLNVHFRLQGLTFTLRDRAYNQYYVYDPTGRTLSVINLDDKGPTLKLASVIDYRTYGDDTVLYVTDTGASKGKMQVRLQKGESNYLMREVTQSPAYLIAIGKLNNSPVIAIGVASENKITILRDPQTYLKANPKQSIPLATTVLQVLNPTEVSFSTDQSVVMARSAQSIATHNFEEDKTSLYELPIPISETHLQWVDGKHLTAVSNGDSYVFDFNGENVQKLVGSIDGLGTFFDNSYQSVYTFSTGTGGKLFNINRTLLRPKN